MYLNKIIFFMMFTTSSVR